MTSTAITERISTPRSIRALTDEWHREGHTVGLVPTMGALHLGHRSLIERAVAECERVVVSIFVNPRQFGPGDDLDRYPRSLDADLRLCADVGADAAYMPSAAAMYPADATTTVRVGGAVTETFEGAFRAGHFDGVATVVAKLFAAARPDRAYFGQKDAQQCAVVRRLAADLDTGVAVIVCPTVRDPDGLALSSRNAYLTAADRVQARAIPAGLADAMRLFDAGERSAAVLVRAVSARLAQSPGVRPDYVAVVDPGSFTEIATVAAAGEIVVAARLGEARLIDVVRLGRDESPVVRRGG